MNALRKSFPFLFPFLPLSSSNREVKELILNEVQISSKSSINDPMPAAAVTPTTPLTASTPIIPSPSSVSIPSVVQHEPSSVPNAQLHAHQSIPNSHHRVNDQSQTATTIAAHHHIDQTMLVHQHQLTSATATANKSLVSQPNQHDYTEIDQYEPQLYSNHYNATGIIHPTMNNHQHSSEFVDLNYYNNYYAYDDQLRPYSASSNSCSSSNSDGDSHLTAHGMHYSNNNNIHLHHHNHHSSHHHIGQTGGTLSTNASATAVAATPAETGDGPPNGAEPIISPHEYSDCMNRQPQHIFELNCFGGIGHAENASNTHQLHDNYMHEYSKNHIGDIHHMSAHVATNGAGIANAAILGSAELSASNCANVEAIQYTSVIVEPTNYHMTNEYVH